MEPAISDAGVGRGGVGSIAEAAAGGGGMAASTLEADAASLSEVFAFITSALIELCICSTSLRMESSSASRIAASNWALNSLA